MSMIFVFAEIVILGIVIYRTKATAQVKLTLAAIFSFLCFEEYFVAGLSRQGGAAYTNVGYSFGHQIYTPYHSQAVLLLLIAFLVAAQSLKWESRVRLGSLAALSGVLLLVFVIAGSVGVNDASFQLKSYLLAAAFFLVGRQVVDSEYSSSQWFWWIVSGVSGIAVCRSAALLILGHSAAAVPFYDGLTTYAVLLFGVIILASKQMRMHQFESFLTLLACVLTVGLGLRRTVTSVALIIMILYPVFSGSKNKLRQIVLRLSLTGVAVAALWSRIDGAYRVVTTGSGETSGTGHLSDITIGTYYCGLANIFQRTVGQVQGAVAGRSSVLYLHNDYLQQCVLGGRFYLGLSVVAAVLITIISVISLLRFDEHQLLARYCAASLLGIPVIMWFFPYFSATNRWPCFIGLGLGITLKQMEITKRGVKSMDSPMVLVGAQE